MIERFGTIKGLEISPNLSQVVAASGRLIFISGQVSRNEKGEVVGKGDIRVQTRQVYENIGLALRAAGAKFSDVVQISTFVTDRNEFRKALDIRREYFGNDLPTATTVMVAGLAGPDLMIEISAIAVLSAEA